MSSVILSRRPLGFPWVTFDPFLFCVHHDDAYPAGNAELGPAASLAGRNIGMDFEGKDGWRMYHGDRVPGFPQHPHRGFETITVVRTGLVDHSDSLGATARFGAGDVQWMTAGRGIQHAEMFPLVQTERPNPTEFFQIWLNLPSKDKLVPPYFTMFWNDTVPVVTSSDEEGRKTRVQVVAGNVGKAAAPTPPPNSWAASPDHDVAIWPITLEPRARHTLPPARAGTTRTLYFYSGSSVEIADQTITEHGALQVRADVPLPLHAGDGPCELLVLQGRPIGEPVARHGPFVMNTRAELVTTFSDYRRTGFGRWPWDRADPVHPRPMGRFARHADGKVEKKG